MLTISLTLSPLDFGLFYTDLNELRILNSLIHTVLTVLP